MSKDISTEEAEQVLKEETEKRAEVCRKEVQEILDKNNCVIDIAMILTVKGNIPKIQIVPKL